jgi:uncharacterized protein YcbX
MPQISQLFIYPVKSLGGIALSKALVTSRGLQYDRRWMLVDENNHFLSQRKLPQMAHFKLALLADGLEVTHKLTLSKKIIPFVPQNNEKIKVKIWDDECIGTYVSIEHDEWFSEKLSFKCRLVYMDDDSIRPVDPEYAGPENITSFADAYPMLLISEASLSDLNSKLSIAVGMERFRPNIVIKDTDPYIEDKMLDFEVAGINFYGVKPCARCVMIGVDQQTAIVNAEPLKTLSGYRKANNKIYFGQNLIHHGDGIVTVGDELNIKQLGNPVQLNALGASL